jgi:transposase
LNGDYFQQFLDKFSSNFEGSTIILQMDKAPAHITQDIDWPENIIPIYQPSYSPELNPIERLWEYIKSQLKWEIFADLDALRQRVQQILQELSPTLVQSITGWDIFIDALLSSSS